MSDKQLDCKGINCPMPIVRISQAVRGMEPGQVLEVEASDPAFESDVKAWARMTGHKILEFTDCEVVQRVRIQVVKNE